jgi:hypothetical protein
MQAEQRAKDCDALRVKLTPRNFWVTEYLEQRLLLVELNYCAGSKGNFSTIEACARYSEELLQLQYPELGTSAERLQACGLSVEATLELKTLFALVTSGVPRNASDHQAFQAVSAYMHLVFTRTNA